MPPASLPQAAPPFSPAGITVRLEHDQHAAGLRAKRSQAWHRFLSGFVREIVDDGHAAGSADSLQPSLQPFSNRAIAPTASSVRTPSARAAAIAASAFDALCRPGTWEPHLVPLAVGWSAKLAPSS